MNTLILKLRDDQQEFIPCQQLEGGAFWQLEKPPASVEARLFYYTKGKGSQDIVVVDKVKFDNPKTEEAQKFAFKLPQSPYSFSGKLISLIWAVELVADSTSEAGRLEFILSPTGKEIILSQHQSASDY